MLLELCEINNMLHECQMGFGRQRSVIDPVARVIGCVQMAWAEGKIVRMLLINLKGVFYHVS